MNKKFLLSLILLPMIFSACMETRYITEKYIKTKIENHNEGEYSTINTYSIYKGTTYNESAYIELTGYKYANNKALVIGADRYYKARENFNGDQTIIAEITYIELSLEQCKDILTNYKVLLDKLENEKPKRSEEIYHDFTVSKDLFISYRKSSGASILGFIDLWIQGEKYSIATFTLIDKLNKFINY
ncbi:MAG: hypothetical protein ACOVP5_06135 [Chitinophagales bacterium]